MTQLDVELGVESQSEQETMNMINYTMRYLVKNGEDMSPEMIDLSTAVCSGIVQQSYGVPKISALHMMSIMLTHTGEHAFAAEYTRMCAEEVEKSEFRECVGVEYQ